MPTGVQYVDGVDGARKAVREQVMYGADWIKYYSDGRVRFDADGRLHVIRDKVPIFTVERLDADGKYPTPGVVRCEILERLQDEKGRELVRICTEKPDGIESTEGLRDFIVTAGLLTDLA